MAKRDSIKALEAILSPEDDELASAERTREDSLPGLDARIDLFLRAMHGTEAASTEQRENARIRIIDAMAADFVGEAHAFFEQDTHDVAAVAPTRPAAAGTARASSTFTSLWEPLREALLWPLTLSAGQPMRLAAVACAAVLVMGGGWTATWFYAAHRTETAIASWIDSEAKAGRDYSCGSRSVGGFPLHVEVSCTALEARLAMSEHSTMVISANSLRTVASIFSPGTYVTEISGPVSITNSGQSASLVGNWSLAQLTVRGQPANPRQVSMVLDNPQINRVGNGSDRPVLAGGQIELTASARAGSAINIAAHAVDVSIPDGGAITSRPFVADISGVLHDIDAPTPQLWSERLRDWQSRGGRLEVAQARIQQGDALATGAGQLRLSGDGLVEGTLHVNTSGPYQQLAQSYIRNGNSGAREREQLALSFLGDRKIRTRSLGGPLSDRGADTGDVRHQPAKQAGNLEIPIRIVDGTVYLGSTGLGEIPPLF